MDCQTTLLKNNYQRNSLHSKIIYTHEGIYIMKMNQLMEKTRKGIKITKPSIKKGVILTPYNKVQGHYTHMHSHYQNKFKFDNTYKNKTQIPIQNRSEIEPIVSIQLASFSCPLT